MSEVEKTGTVQDTHVSEKNVTEKSTIEINDGHEPYDAQIQNITLGEFPLHPPAHHGDSLKDELLHEEVLDLYKPFPIDPEIVHEEHILTFRAVLTGICLGALVNASNLYLGKGVNQYCDEDIS